MNIFHSLIHIPENTPTFYIMFGESEVGMPGGNVVGQHFGDTYCNIQGRPLLLRLKSMCCPRVLLQMEHSVHY